jgi:hypothetical protein
VGFNPYCIAIYQKGVIIAIYVLSITAKREKNTDSTDRLSRADCYVLKDCI